MISSKFPKRGRGRGPGGNLLGLRLFTWRKSRQTQIHSRITAPHIVTVDLLLWPKLLYSEINSGGSQPAY